MASEQQTIENNNVGKPTEDEVTFQATVQTSEQRTITKTSGETITLNGVTLEENVNKTVEETTTVIKTSEDGTETSQETTTVIKTSEDGTETSQETTTVIKTSEDGTETSQETFTVAETSETKPKTPDETVSHDTDKTEPAEVVVAVKTQASGTGERTEAEEEGPDAVADAEGYMATAKDQAVKLRLQDGIEGAKPITVYTLIKNQTTKNPDVDALAIKRDGAWVRWTYKQYYEDARTVAKAFLELGLERFGAVGILGFNSPEWFLSELGSMLAGGISVGIYATNSPEACHFIVEDSGCHIVVVENDAQLQKILQVRDRLPLVKTIVQYDGELKKKKVPTATLR